MNSTKQLPYSTSFRVLSYAAVLCGFASLWISGTFGFLGVVIYLSIAAASFFLDDSRFQFSERIGTTITVIALPAFFLLWKINFFQFSGPDTALPGVLSRLILTLSAIKLLQKKSDRDWIFLYVMAFFQLLLAAGLSISALYLAIFVTYVLLMTATIILFEVRRAGTLIADRRRTKRGPVSTQAFPEFSIRRLPFVAASLLCLIVLIAAPLFFVLPRVGGAGLGGSLGGVSTYSGFSDTVRLGGIGRIQQNDQVVMRVRIEDREKVNVPIRWRGIALDTFDHRSWSKSKPGFREARGRGEQDLIQIDYATGRDSLIVQNVFLEPLDSQVLFAMERAVAIQTGFRELYLDAHDSVSFPRVGERITYKVLSDISRPSETDLRNDREFYPRSAGNYLQLPDGLDPRIAERAEQITETATNRYDAAKLIEYHLRNDFGYTLEQKAGGDQPLSDFLFNVREGHCEYFASAMAIMLRTQGIATRVVNGFQQGEYNETADAFVVRQREAHAWVEVLFPGENIWISFDPTPAAAQTFGTNAGGFYEQLSNYIDALELIWIQYFVAYDSQEQRSMFSSIRRGVADYNEKTSSVIDDVRVGLVKWWNELKGASGLSGSISALGLGIASVAFMVALLLLAVRFYRFMANKIFDSWGAKLMDNDTQYESVEFYNRMLEQLEKRGLNRRPSQTPLEFANDVAVPGVVDVTTIYNRVRFGGGAATEMELEGIERTIRSIGDNNT